MKKLILINLVACAVLAVVLVFTMNTKAECNSQSCSSIKNTNSGKVVMTGADAEEQLFQFNRIYIRI